MPRAEPVVKERWPPGWPVLVIARGAALAATTANGGPHPARERVMSPGVIQALGVPWATADQFPDDRGDSAAHQQGRQQQVADASPPLGRNDLIDGPVHAPANLLGGARDNDGGPGG